MNKNDIRRIYTEQVNGLIAEGFQINPFSMAGTQGELAHTDLARGSEIIRVLLERAYSLGGAYLVIRAGRSNAPENHTVWNDELRTLFEIRLAEVREGYYVTEEEYTGICAKRMQRRKARYGSTPKECGPAYKSAALRWLKKLPGMKTAKATDIAWMYRTRTHDGAVCYSIEARGRHFEMHA